MFSFSMWNKSCKIMTRTPKKTSCLKFWACFIKPDKDDVWFLEDQVPLHCRGTLLAWNPTSNQIVCCIFLWHGTFYYSLSACDSLGDSKAVSFPRIFTTSKPWTCRCMCQHTWLDTWPKKTILSNQWIMCSTRTLLLPLFHSQSNKTYLQKPNTPNQETTDFSKQHFFMGVPFLRHFPIRHFFVLDFHHLHQTNEKVKYNIKVKIY